MNRAFTRRRPNLQLSRALLRDSSPGLRRRTARAFRRRRVHRARDACNFSTISEFRSATATAAPKPARSITLNDFKPFRADTVGKPLPGMEVRIVNPDAEGIGEVAVRSKTVMSHYLDDPEMTAETIVDGWLMTGDLGPLDATGHSAALRPQEKHDRHRRRQEYLSRRYRNCFRRPSP